MRVNSVNLQLIQHYKTSQIRSSSAADGAGLLSDASSNDSLETTHDDEQCIRVADLWLRRAERTPVRQGNVLIIQGGPKKRGHSTFCRISRKLLKISTRFFAHIKASVY